MYSLTPDLDRAVRAVWYSAELSRLYTLMFGHVTPAINVTGNSRIIQRRLSHHPYHHYLYTVVPLSAAVGNFILCCMSFVRYLLGSNRSPGIAAPCCEALWLWRGFMLLVAEMANVAGSFIVIHAVHEATTA